MDKKEQLPNEYKSFLMRYDPLQKNESYDQKSGSSSGIGQGSFDSQSEEEDHQYFTDPDKKRKIYKKHIVKKHRNAFSSQKLEKIFSSSPSAVQEQKQINVDQIIQYVENQTQQIQIDTLFVMSELLELIEFLRNEKVIDQDYVQNIEVQNIQYELYIHKIHQLLLNDKLNEVKVLAKDLKAKMNPEIRKLILSFAVKEMQNIYMQFGNQNTIFQNQLIPWIQIIVKTNQTDAQTRVISPNKPFQGTLSHPGVKQEYTHQQVVQQRLPVENFLGKDMLQGQGVNPAQFSQSSQSSQLQIREQASSKFAQQTLNSPTQTLATSKAIQQPISGASQEIRSQNHFKVKLGSTSKTTEISDFHSQSMTQSQSQKNRGEIISSSETNKDNFYVQPRLTSPGSIFPHLNEH